MEAGWAFRSAIFSHVRWIFSGIYKCGDRNKTDSLLIKNAH